MSKIRSLRRHEGFVTLSTGLFKSAAVIVGCGLAFTLIEALMYNGTTARTVFLALWVLAGMTAFAYFAGKPTLQALGIVRHTTEDELALRVGKHFADVQDRLLNSLQLYRLAVSDGTRAGVSSELALASFGTIGRGVRALNFDAIVNTEPRKRAALTFVSLVLLAGAMFGVFHQTLPHALYRLVHCRQSFVPPPPFMLEVLPAERKALRGESVEIRVLVHGDASALAGEVTLRMRERPLTNTAAKAEFVANEQGFDALKLRADSAGVFRYQLQSLKRSVEFYAEAPWYLEPVHSAVGRVIVIDRPDIRELSGSVIPPSYTKMPPRALDENSAAVMSLSGSRVELAITANTSLKSADIVLLKQRIGVVLDSTTTRRTDTVRIPMTLNDRRAAGAFTANFAGEYYIDITDHNGEHNAEPIRYSVLALQDAAPTIALLQPTTNVEVTEQGILPMKFAVSDDYGFSAVKLRYRLAESRYAQPKEQFASLSLPTPLGDDKTAEIPYVWDINKLGLSPADRYEFYLEVFDNDIVNGPKSARTGILSVRLPSLDEIFKEADKTQDLAAKELQNLLKESEQMKRDMEEISRELRKQQDKPQADWKEKKRLEDVLKKQEEFSRRVEQVRQQLEQMTEKLQQNQTLSPETLQQYMELQKLLKQVDSPELRRAAQQMQRALEQMSPQQMQQALEKYQFNEEDFKRSIERTMKILQRLQANQKTDELAKRAQELLQKQQDLQKQMQNANMQNAEKREELARQQQELQKDLAHLDKQLGELDKLMKDIEQKGGKDMPMEELKKAQEALNKEQTEQAMQQAERQMREGNQQQAQQQQQQAQQNLQKFAQQMQDLKREMQRNVKQEAIRTMQKSLQNMVNLSKRQEQLKRQSQTMDGNSNQFRDAAQQQAQLSQDMRNVISQLMDLAQKSFSVTPQMGKELGEAMQQMDNALDQLEERNSQSAAQSQQQAMGAMNRAATQMQQSLSQMTGGAPGGGSGQGDEGEGQGREGGGSFMERLQQMAAQQQAVNQQMQQMLGQGAGQGNQGGQGGEEQRRLEQSQSEQIGRLAAQQDAIRKSLEEMNRQQKQGGKRALGDLDRLAKEMQEIVSDMRNGAVSEETMRRQERILSRLLDATRSTRERDYEKQREARSGENVVRSSPSLLDLKTQEGRMRALQELMKSSQQGYSKDYEQLIRRYFEALQNSTARAPSPQIP